MQRTDLAQHLCECSDHVLPAGDRGTVAEGQRHVLGVIAAVTERVARLHRGVVLGEEVDSGLACGHSWDSWCLWRVRCLASSQRWRVRTQARSSRAERPDASTSDLPGEREGGVDEGGVDVVPVAQV